MIPISNEQIKWLYEYALLMSKKHSKTNDQWKIGNLKPQYINAIAAVPDKKTFPFLVGLIGEYAFYKYMQILGYKDFPKPDLTIYRNGDDGSDFNYRNKRLQVKTSLKNHRLIKANNFNNGPRQALHFDIVSFIIWEVNSNLVLINGSISKSRVEKIGLVDSLIKPVKWQNISVRDYQLEILSNLLKD